MFVSLEELYYSWRMLHFQNTRKNFFNIPIKFRFCKRLGWSATERDGQTSSIIIKREYFHFSKTSQNIGWMAKSMERVEAGKSRIGSGAGNHPLEIYAALSAAFMPIA